MVHEIGSGGISVGVDALGAELKHIRGADGHEYLWQGSTDSWTGRSPVLFPIIGGLPDDRCRFDGRVYEMKPHGFARLHRWKLEEMADDHLVFLLRSDPETRLCYPFEFKLRLTCRVEKNTLHMEFRLKNTGHSTMVFSLGAHPGFRCPLEEGLRFEDYSLVFNRPESTERLMKSGSLLSGERRPFVLTGGVLPLRHADFEEGAIILEELRSDRITLESPKGSRRVRVDFPGFPQLGLWTYGPSPAPFICIEPWFGLDSTDGVPEDGDLKTKAGMRSLQPDEVFRAAISITPD